MNASQTGLKRVKTKPGRRFGAWRHGLALLGFAFSALPTSASADVIDVGENGALTVYGAPGIYTVGEFRPIISIPQRTHLAGQYQPPTGMIASILSEAANRYAINPNLLEVTAWNESAFQATAVSPKGAFGVMQLMPGTAQRLGVNRYDVSQNILGGAAYLRQMLNRYDGDVSLALAAYNAGPDAVDRYRGIPPFKETRRYVQKIENVLGVSISSAQFVTFIDQ